MRSEKQKQEYRIGTGATNMLMILVVISLTTLSILSLSSARADYTMSARNSDIIKAYYGAVAETQRILADIDAKLKAAQTSAADADEYDAMIQSIADDSEYTMSLSGDVLAFEVDAGYERVVELNLRISPYGQSGGRYDIFKHVIRSTGDWEEGETYELFFDLDQIDASLYGDDGADSIDGT